MERLRSIANLWNWLPAFRAVAETGNLRLAAERLHVSPSALSRTVRLLEDEIELRESVLPRLVDFADFELQMPDGGRRNVRLSAVVMNVGPTRGAMVVVDNEARDIYGQVYLDRPAETIELEMRLCARNVMDELRRRYDSARPGEMPPAEGPTLRALRDTVATATARCPGS